MQIPIIPPGPAWAVAIGLVFSGLALLMRASAPIVQAIRRNGKNGPQPDAAGRAEAVAKVKEHLDDVAAEARDHREKIMGNIDRTRHDLATPLTVLNGHMALMQLTLIEIRDRLPRREV